MLIEPTPGHCLVVAAQNTNHMPRTQSEVQGINSTIAFPDTKKQTSGKPKVSGDSPSAIASGLPTIEELSHGVENQNAEHFRGSCS